MVRKITPQLHSSPPTRALKLEGIADPLPPLCLQHMHACPIPCTEPPTTYLYPRPQGSTTKRLLYAYTGVF